MEEPNINDLPEELILKIFSFLRMFKETKLVSDVMFDDDEKSYDQRFVTFMTSVYGYLLFNNAQVLERLHLKLSRNYSASDIKFLVQITVNRSVRKLRIQLFGKTLELPSFLSTCKTLKSLILHEVRIKVRLPFCITPLTNSTLIQLESTLQRSPMDFPLTDGLHIQHLSLTAPSSSRALE
ncbi:hypothetical protein EUTSA_v10015778mg [Eutrema salsugineum]|uniref:F-box domain-containing protein n=1 Tax=Eutrema salsugineum TaxID=72664 RepID=V4NAC1_EUTSA|nr:hypothetical protein EUTSA_v10015778mg [Eutrema salsugineum]